MSLAQAAIAGDTDMAVAARVEALEGYAILDTAEEQGYDDIVMVASQICATPVSLVTLLTGDRQWFKAKHGFSGTEMPIGHALCVHALPHAGVTVIPDLLVDARTRANPIVTDGPRARFYAGARLESSGGIPLGTLCVVDLAPRPEGLSQEQERGLAALARQVMARMELRRALAERDTALAKAREGETRYRQVLASARDSAIVTLDMDGLVTGWNPGAERILGWTAAEMLGRPMDVAFTPEDRAAGIPSGEMWAARERGFGEAERWHMRKDATRFWASGEMMPLLAADGSQAGYLKILRDRTERRLEEERARATERALALSEERQRLAAEAAGTGIFDLDIASGRLQWDARLREMFGTPPDGEITYAGDFLPRLHPEDRGRVEALVGAAIDPDGDGTLDVEYRLAAATDGEAPWISAKGRTFSGPGTGPRLVGTVRDVSQRKRAELAVRATEERFRLATLATNDAIWDWDLVEDRILWNDSLRTAYGHDPANIDPSGSWWLGRVHPDDREGVERDIRQTIAGAGNDWKHEYRFMRVDGRYADVLDRGYMVRGERGEPVRMIGAMLDLTERKRSERRLRELNANLAGQVEARTLERDMVWRTSQDLILICALDGTCLDANPAWKEGFDLDPAALSGRPSADLFHADDRPAYAGMVARLATGSVVRDVDLRTCPADGVDRTYSWTFIPEEGRYYGSGRDVTGRRNLEEQLRQAQKMEAVGQLTGGLAHDFNNLLTGISGSLELLQTRMAQGRTGDLDRYINAAQGASKRAAALTHRLLAFSRRQTLDPKPTDVDALVHGMEDLIRRTVGPSVDIDVVCERPLWRALVDPNQLENALLNLCINARDAMPDGGRITIETANRRIDDRAAAELGLAPGQYLSLRVADTGTGMTPEVQARAFDPFFTTKPMGEGTGLGLSMIYGFATQSGGQVRIRSEVGFGTSIGIHLPRHHGEADGTEEGIALRDAPRAEEGQTVLVVDDEPTVRMLVTEVLDDLGYTAIEAADGAGGLRVLQSDARIDLLVSDVGLPGGMNGRQMADAARIGRPDLKVLFITGYAEAAVVGNGHLAPGMAVMTKPFVMEALASRIKDLIAG